MHQLIFYSGEKTEKALVECFFVKNGDLRCFLKYVDKTTLIRVIFFKG